MVDGLDLHVREDSVEAVHQCTLNSAARVYDSISSELEVLEAEGIEEAERNERVEQNKAKVGRRTHPLARDRPNYLCSFNSKIVQFRKSKPYGISPAAKLRQRLSALDREKRAIGDDEWEFIDIDIESDGEDYYPTEQDSMMPCSDNRMPMN